MRWKINLFITKENIKLTKYVTKITIISSTRNNRKGYATIRR